MTTQTPTTNDRPEHCCVPFEVRAEDIRNEFASLAETEAAARLVNMLATALLVDAMRRTLPLGDLISHTADAVLVFDEEPPKAA